MIKLIIADCEGPGGSVPLAGHIRVNSGFDNLRRRSELVHRVLPPISRSSSHSSSLQGPSTKKVSSMPLSRSDRNPPNWPIEVADLLYPRFLYVFSDVVCFVTRQVKYVSLKFHDRPND